MKKFTFSEVLKAAVSLSIEDREKLIDQLHKLTIEELRTELSEEIRIAQNHYKHRKYTTDSSKENINEILL